MIEQLPRRGTSATIARTIAALLALTAAARGADWPTYLHDAARSGATGESLAVPLALEWTFEPAGPPAAGWGEVEEGAVWKVGLPFRQPVAYDDAYHVAAAGGDVFFCASGEHKVYCLDAARGTVRWTAYTSAPARCAPTVRDGRVYLGDDNGFVYCLRAGDGSTVWRRRAAPQADRTVGQGRLMSLRPVRTGVLVDGDRAYFAAGLYANCGLSLHAVAAADGAPVWTQTDFGRGEGATCQGYLLMDAERIVVPSGRTFPLVFDRGSGRLRGRVTIGRSQLNGGSYAVLAGNLLLNGTSCMTAYDLAADVKDKWGRPLFGPPVWSWFAARAVVPSGEMLYMVNDTDVFAVPRAAAAAACGAQTGFDTNKQPDWSKCAWRKTDQNVPDALILAGDRLVAGGAGKVAVYDAASGEVLWTRPVEGRARGLAVANGRLLVSTTTGRIYSFAANGSGKRIAARTVTPLPADRLSAFYARTADAIVEQSKAGRGFGLVIGGAAGGRPGQLACELARRTELRIQLLEPDPKRAAEARAAIDRAGYFGTRVSVDCCTDGGEGDSPVFAGAKTGTVPGRGAKTGTVPARGAKTGTVPKLDYPPYFANLVVCEEAFFGGRVRTPAAEVAKVLRPCGGVAFAGQPPSAEQLGAAIEAVSLGEWLRGFGDDCDARVAGGWAAVRRGKLAGAADWDHQGANPGNTYCNEDGLARPPFGILWFGAPGPRDVLDRHDAGSAPLVTEGRMLVVGKNAVSAYDAYNGAFLWRRDVPEVHRERMPLNCSGMAAAGDRVFLASQDRCLRLAAATGAEEQVYRMPARADGQKRLWGWIAVRDKLLLGSRTETPRAFRGWPAPSGNTSEALFAVDLESGKTLWTREGRGIPHNAVALVGPRLFFIEATADAPPAPPGKAADDGGAEGKAPAPDVRRLVALDAATGRELWRENVDVRDCVVHPRPGSGDWCGGEVTLMGKGNILVLCGSPFHEDHELEPFRRGVFARRSLTAFDAASGRKLWSKPANYQTRPIIVGQTIYAEPWFFDLATGAQKTDAEGKPLTLVRNSGCGGFAASAGTLFFRKGPLSYFDLERRGAAEPLVAGQRPSCWISFVPAGGIVVAPEGSAGCTCAYAIQGSVALYPK